MKKCYFLLVFTFVCAASGRAQSNFYFKVGDLNILVQNDISDLQKGIDSLFQSSHYDLIFNFETQVVNRLKSDSAAQFEKLEHTLRKRSDRFHSKKAPVDKIRIIFHLYALINQTKKGRDWHNHLLQFISFDENIEISKKIKLSKLKLKINFTNENTLQNKELLRELILQAHQILRKPPNQFEEMKLGPLEIVFIEDLKIKDDSAKAGSARFYTSPYIQFKMNLLDSKIKYRDIAIDSARISLQISENFDQISAIQISGKSSNGIYLDNLYGIDIFLESFSISLDDNQSESLQGEVVLKAISTTKKQLSLNLFLHPGVNGKFSFQFNSQPDAASNGAFDFSGIEDIHLALEIEQQTLVAIKDAKLDSAGTFVGDFSIEESINVALSNYYFQIEKMQGRLNFGLVIRPEIEKYSASFSIHGINGLSSGKLALQVNSDSLGNIIAKVDSSSSYLRFNGFNVNKFFLQATLTDLFQLESISGSATAIHESFENEIKIERIEIIDGELNHVEGSGYISVNDFIFKIESLSYFDKIVRLDAKVMLNTTGIETWIQTSDFTIDSTGKILIKDISAELNKDPFKLKFKAAWSDSRFKGSFAGQFAGIAVDGKLDLGAAIEQSKSFNFAFLTLNASNKIGIPLGATGMKLTKLGGSIGYNYLLVFNLEDLSKMPEGSPELNQYLLGCTMGLCDVAGYCEVEGNVLVQFGKNDFQLILGGKVAIPRKEPIIASGIKLLYQPDKNSIGGELTTRIQIPPASGFIFNTPEILSHFNLQAQKWSFRSDHIEASILNLLNYNGNLSFSGNLTNQEISGNIEGSLSYHFNQQIDKSFEILEQELGRINANLTLDLLAQSTIKFDPHKFFGRANGKVTGAIDLNIISGIGSFSISSSVQCDAMLEIKEDRGLISGKASVYLESTIWSEQYEYDIIKSI